MDPIHSTTLEYANEAAIYNIYLYLVHKATPAEHESLRSIVTGLETAFRKQKHLDWKARDIYRLSILKNAVERSAVLANSKISNLTRSQSGLTACSFTNTNGSIFVVFRGTGGGEWIDNGEGLSGIPEENTYLTYGRSGNVLSHRTVQDDYSTTQQVEALNWFYAIAAKSGWDDRTHITLSGHSKGGNKAQFITIHSDLVDACYSFDGQGFSPEALTAFKDRLGAKFEIRRRNIYSFSADNDYVNVLGERVMPEDQIYYFESILGFHYLEAILDKNGRFHSQCEQGKLSRYVESVSKELMDMKPFVRQYATLGIMNVFHKYLGDGTSVNGDTVSLEKTVAGIGVAIGPLLHNLPR